MWVWKTARSSRSRSGFRSGCGIRCRTGSCGRRRHTREQVTQQARRMLGDPRARAKMQAFFHHWLQMDRIENVSKDEKIFPEFTPAIIADLRTSLDLFLADTLWSETADY